MVSDIARTFDVLGWLAPVILEMKVLYRSLWQRKLGWDQEVPPDLKRQHEAWREALPSLADIRLPRHYFDGRKPKSISLHGFSDASSKAFAAVIYLRAVYEEGPPTSVLVLAKTRVAPLIERTIPELELCGAHLLAKLLETTSLTLDVPKSQIFAYSDSTIVLAWLDGSPKRYRLYVANRISKTVRLMPPSVWNYVPTTLNPADCASRGISAADLLSHSLWWHGPPWLLEQPLVVPTRPNRSGRDQLLDEEHQPKSQQLQMVGAVFPPPDTRIEESSNSWKRVVKVLCWMNRFISRTRKKPTSNSRNLSVTEFNIADLLLKKISQLRSFSLKLHQLSSEPPQPLPSKCSILALHPEINKDGLLCVGGRLRNALIEDIQKHPVILSPKDRYTKLLFVHYHHELMHGGPTVILAHSGTMFYVTGERRLAREICRSCVICRKAAAKTGPQLMGQLPPDRLDPEFAFNITGLDYAGPYLLKEGYVRRPVEIKAWMAVFVCFHSKAVHLELVKDATAASLIACLGRFCSRRGRPNIIHSDNGSTMVGAKNELAAFYSMLQSSDTQDTITSYLLSQKVKWKLTPVKAPHFGGLWEAAVKAAKYHIKREVGHSRYTYDELETILCQAEACLNSRPLGVMASHPIDGQVPLTPGHFLIGRAIKAYPTETVDYNPGLLQRWAHCTKVVQRFWRRWSNEYLQQLQRATKWHRKTRDYAIGDFVLLTDHSTYQCQWIHAKVVAVYPGKDGIVRAVDLQIEHISTPDKWQGKQDFLLKLKRRTTICRRPVAQLTLLLPAEDLPEDCKLQGKDVPLQEPCSSPPPQHVLTQEGSEEDKE